MFAVEAAVSAAISEFRYPPLQCHQPHPRFPAWSLPAVAGIPKSFSLLDLEFVEKRVLRFTVAKSQFETDLK